MACRAGQWQGRGWGLGGHEGRTEGSREQGPLSVPPACSARVCDRLERWGPDGRGDGHVFMPLSPTVISMAGDMYPSECETLERFLFFHVLSCERTPGRPVIASGLGTEGNVDVLG